MKIETVLEALEHNTGRFPRQAFEAATARRREITPHLLEIVEECTSSIDRLVTDKTYMGHIYAFYLLAQFREHRAYPLIVDFFSIPGDMVVDVTGDVVTEDLGRILASVSGGDREPMEFLVENPETNEYVRLAAMTGMLCLFVEGLTPREELIAYFRDLFRGALQDDHRFVWGGVVSAGTDLYPEELMPDIRRAFAAGLVDETYIDLPWVESVLARGKDECLARLSSNPRYRLLSDAIDAMQWWACFDSPPPSEPQKKVGRNDPCPCGSGRKYKHCCLRR